MKKAKLFERFKIRWVQKELTFRIRQLAVQSLAYLILTFVMLGGMGAIIQRVFEQQVAYAGISFLAILYCLIAGITISRQFDTNSIKYRLDQIAENTDTGVMVQLRRDLDELEKKNGLS